MPLIAAAAVTGVASLGSAAIQSSAANKSSKIAQQTAQQQLAAQETARNDAARVLTPYAQEGATARGKVNALLGLGGGQTTSGGDGTDWNAFLAQNQDIVEQARAEGRDPVEYVKAWAPGNQASFQARMNAFTAPAAEQAQATAMDEFRRSPFYTTTRAAGEAGRNAILGTAAARGGTVSGKAQRAVSDFTNEHEQGALASYLSSLNGVAATGYSADTGIASGGQTFANNTSAILGQQSQTQIAGTQAAANAGTDALKDLSSFAGFAYGASRMPKTPQPTTGGVSTGGGLANFKMPQSSLMF